METLERAADFDDAFERLRVSKCNILKRCLDNVKIACMVVSNIHAPWFLQKVDVFFAYSFIYDFLS